MKLITVIGRWNILELEDIAPHEFAVTNGDRIFHNRMEDAAIRLAELLDKHDKDEKVEA